MSLRFVHIGALFLFIVSLGQVAHSMNGTSPELVEMCNKATISSRVPDCLKKFRGKYVDPLSIDACNEATISSRVPDCVVDLADLEFTLYAYQACDKATISSRVPACMKGLGNLLVTEGDLQVCNKATIASRVPACLADLSSPTQPGKNPQIATILEQILVALNNDDISGAKTLIFQLLGTL